MKCTEPRCQNEFYPTTPNRRFCSLTCRKRYHDRLGRERERLRREGQIVEGITRERTHEENEFLAKQAEALLDSQNGAAPSSQNLDSVLQDLGYSGKKKDNEK